MTRVLDLWPRRAAGLPPGQRRLAVFPRFGDAPARRPPDPAGPITISVGGGGETFVLGPTELAEVGRIEAVRDFHCVTTWTHCGVRWGGWPMVRVWEQLVAPAIDPLRKVRYVVARGGDGYRAVLDIDDLLDPDVLLATTLDGEPLDRRHGAPLRLVSPPQYGYKSVKHLVGFELCERAPESRLGPKEHLRARVALEERHSRLPGRLLRLPYRSTIPATAILAERALRARDGSADAGRGTPADGRTANGR